MTSSFICEKCGGTTFDQMTYTQARCLQCGYLNLHDSGFKGQREFQLSPDKDLLNVEIKTRLETAPLIKRFVNYLVDVIFMAIIMTIVASIAKINISDYSMIGNRSFQFIIFGTMVVYSTIMEFAFGKTLGKFFTKTHVISVDASQLTLLQCLFRSLVKFIIPFEFLTGLFFKGIFWHDSFPKTMVVED